MTTVFVLKPADFFQIFIGFPLRLLAGDTNGEIFKKSSENAIYMGGRNPLDTAPNCRGIFSPTALKYWPRCALMWYNIEWLPCLLYQREWHALAGRLQGISAGSVYRRLRTVENRMHCPRAVLMLGHVKPTGGQCILSWLGQAAKVTRPVVSASIRTERLNGSLDCPGR